MVAADVFARLPCGVYSKFVQQRIQDASMAVHSTVGFSFVHSIVQLSLLLAMFQLIFVSRVCGYVRSNHLSGF